MTRDIRWWRETFAGDRDRWRESLLSAPGEEQRAWRRAVRSWPRPAELDGEADEVTAGPLAGVPFGVKDLFDQKDNVTLAGSILLKQIGTPATEDALIVRKLRELGAIPVGRTNMNEFAYGLDGFNPHTGNCPHPVDPQRISGGSSSGSAWIVARGILPIALGTDTGGSIRVPAAFCAVYGFRGIPDESGREGVFPLSRSFDTAGWFTRSAADMAAMIELFYGWPARTQASAEGETSARAQASARGETTPAETTGKGIYYAPAKVELTPEVAAAYDGYLRSTDLVETDSPTAGLFRDRLDAVIDEAFWAYNVIGSCEAFDVHSRWFTEHKRLYNPDVWRLIDRSRHWEPGALDYAGQLKEEISSLLRELLNSVDALVMPAVHTVAPKMEEVDQPFRVDIIRLTSLASLAGLPVITIPLKTEGGLSCGLQLITTPEKITAVARTFLSRRDA